MSCNPYPSLPAIPENTNAVINGAAVIPAPGVDSLAGWTITAKIVDPNTRAAIATKVSSTPSQILITLPLAFQIFILPGDTNGYAGEWLVVVTGVDASANSWLLATYNLQIFSAYGNSP